jgi:hypothetical protein
MDVRAFYQKMREAEATMAGEHVVVISLATPDGGKAGVRTEVAREDAARMIVEQRARLADPDEAEEYRRGVREVRERADQAAAAERLQVTIVSDSDLRALRDRGRQKG